MDVCIFSTASVMRNLHTHMHTRCTTNRYIKQTINSKYFILPHSINFVISWAEKVFQSNARGYVCFKMQCNLWHTNKHTNSIILIIHQSCLPTTPSSGQSCLSTLSLPSSVSVCVSLGICVVGLLLILATSAYKPVSNERPWSALHPPGSPDFCCLQ